MADNAWCERHNIPLSSFYNAVTRLRKKACAIQIQLHNLTTCIPGLYFTPGCGQDWHRPLRFQKKPGHMTQQILTLRIRLNL
ncbi:hypothetical protein [Enterocloster sp.]|uniref:hypothetical protein n=1 Tax=Enterocloster sp. TaxID=2719315 RepID=UPI0039A1F898